MKTAFRVYDLKRCLIVTDQEKRGMFGWHNIADCPDCIKTYRGFEVYHGDNILSGLWGYYPTQDTLISHFPIYYHK